MVITSLKVWDDFDLFLKGIGKQRADMVMDAMNRFAKGELELDPKTCEHFRNRDKVLLHDANVVVYYDIRETRLELIGGSENETRVA